MYLSVFSIDWKMNKNIEMEKRTRDLERLMNNEKILFYSMLALKY